MSLREFVRRLYREYVDDAVTDSAAQLAYYLLFSLFPFLFFVVTVSAYFPVMGKLDALLERAAVVVPDTALEIIRSQLQNLFSQKRQKLLTLSLLTSIWSASRGLDALRRAMNLAYDVTESRPYWKTQGIAMGMTLAGAILIPVAFTMFVLGSELGVVLAHKLHVDVYYQFVWSWLRWPLTAFLVMWALALNYYFLPDVEQEFKFITPGSVLATVAWILTTWGFTQYVTHFGNFNVTYGSIGGVMVLMLWLYLGGLIFIMGGEVNAIIEHASREGKAKGARKIGETPPTADGVPLPITAGAAKRAESAERLRWRFWRRRRPRPA